MPSTLSLEILEDNTIVFTAEQVGRVELGRQDNDEPRPYALIPAQGEYWARLLVARKDEKTSASRHHALLEILESGAVRITNLTKVPLPFAVGDAVPPGQPLDRQPPFALVLAGRIIRVAHGDSVDSDGSRSLAAGTVGPDEPRSHLSALGLPVREMQALDDLVGWLQRTLGVLQSAVASSDFLQRAVEAMVDIVGLDSGRALFFAGDAWRIAAQHPPGDGAWEPSGRMLQRVRAEKKTFWQQPGLATARGTSLAGLDTVLAAPLRARDGSVRGALYGERRSGRAAARPVGKAEALLVDLLAGGVAAGLARQEEEQKALAARVRFEQFFTPELAQHLAKQPDLLDGREAQVTLLFCDIRGFSRISERVGPAATVGWIGSVMDRLSEKVLAEGGVLVDYIGDELLAMWGAPAEQPDHARRALRAALAFVAALPELNAEWAPKLGEPMDLGIGLNSGPAQVGNTGSQYKFKYGPLGNTVNLASRVQGLTKYLKCRLLVTDATRRQAGPGFLFRRVCCAHVVNIQEPVSLYEAAAEGDEDLRLFFQESEHALQALEERRFAEASMEAGSLLHVHRGDGPLRLTLVRASEMLLNEGGPFDPCWTPPGK